MKSEINLLALKYFFKNYSISDLEYLRKNSQDFYFLDQEKPELELSELFSESNDKVKKLITKRALFVLKNYLNSILKT
jgi:hypothetical protein